MTQYRCTIVTTRDYGDSPAAGKQTFATLARIPDGGPWWSVPQTIEIEVPDGTRPGRIYEMKLELLP